MTENNRKQRSLTVGHREGRLLANATNSTNNSTDNEAKWIDAYTKLAISFQEKENEIVQVAELGQALLEQNRKNEELVTELNISILERDKVIADLEKELRAQRKQSSKLNLGVKELSLEDDGTTTPDIDSTPNHVNESVSYLETQYKDLQVKYDLVRESLHHQETELEDTIKNHQKKERLYTKEISDLKTMNDDYSEQIAKLNSSLEEATAREQQYKLQINQLENQKKEAQNTIEILQKQNEQLDIMSQRESKAKTQKQSEISILKAKLMEFDSQIQEYKSNEVNLQETVSALVKRNSSLHQENEELQGFVIEYKQTRRPTVVDVPSPQLSRTPDSHEPKFQNSLLSELEESLQQKLKDEIKEGKDFVASSQSNSNGGMKDDSGIDSNFSESEFFFLTAAAIKVGLIMKFPHKSSIIVQVNIKKLYEHAQQNNVPFHEWHAFLTSSFGNIMFRDNTSNGVGTLQNLLTTNETTLFSTEFDTPIKSTSTPTKISLFDDKSGNNDQMNWLEMGHPKAPRNAVETMSPYPEQNELLHKLFKCYDSEFVVEFFNCNLDEQIKGTLFVSLEAIYFYAKPTVQPPKFPEIKITLKFVDITSILIKKGFLGFRSSAIVVTARNTGNVPKFTFDNFKNLDYSYEIMYKHWKNWKDDEKKSHHHTPVPVAVANPESPVTDNSAAPTNLFKKDRKRSSTWNIRL